MIQSQSLWRPYFEEEQKRFHSSSHMPAFTQAKQACDKSHMLPSVTLNRLSNLFALQVGEVHAAHCPTMDSCVTKPFALLFTNTYCIQAKWCVATALLHDQPCPEPIPGNKDSDDACR